MAADVSTMVRLLSGGGGEEGSPKSDLVTRDLLGGCCVVGGGGAAPSPAPKKAPFPDLHVLSGGEKGLQPMDLNLPPLWPSAPLRPRQMAALETSVPAQDLRLRSLVPPPPPPVGYQSVCTLEKVKSALERAERETWRRQQQKQDPPAQPRRAPARSSSPTSSSTTTSSAKRRLGGGAEEGEEESGSSPGMEAGVAKGDGGAAHTAAEMAAAGCPSCLMYVLISRSNPRCPRCRSAVPLPPPPPHAGGKKPRIDLNAATTTSVAAVSSSPITTVKFF